RVLFALATLGFVAASWVCALSINFEMLITARVVQGFFGGMLIPSVFTAVFVLIPQRHEVLATTLAGGRALLGPTLGLLLGGWLADRDPILALDLSDQHFAGPGREPGRASKPEGRASGTRLPAPDRSSFAFVVRGLSGRVAMAVARRARPPLAERFCFRARGF